VGVLAPTQPSLKPELLGKVTAYFW